MSNVETKVYSEFSAKMIAAKMTKKTGQQHHHVEVSEGQFIVEIVVAHPVKLTNIVLHINTGEKKSDGKNKQVHVVLFNRQANTDQFFGGAASVINGKLEILSEEIEGQEFPQISDPYILFVNRAKTTGRVMSLSIMQDKNKVGEIKFKKMINGKEMLTGTYNPRGLQFDEKYHVVSEENNRAIFAEVRGGLKGEIFSAMIGKVISVPFAQDSISQAA